MGYYYEINGEIQFCDKKAFAIMKLLYNENQEPFNEEIEGFDFVDESKRLDININIKNLDAYIEKLCLFAYTLDKGAEGQIDVIGEDNEDKSYILIDENGIKISQAQITWKDLKGHFKDKDVIRNVKILLKDKELNKKLICLTLEGK
jgi:hypothetical protein